VGCCEAAAGIEGGGTGATGDGTVAEARATGGAVAAASPPGLGVHGRDVIANAWVGGGAGITGVSMGITMSTWPRGT